MHLVPISLLKLNNPDENFQVVLDVMAPSGALVVAAGNFIKASTLAKLENFQIPSVWIKVLDRKGEEVLESETLKILKTLKTSKATQPQVTAQPQTAVQPQIIVPQSVQSAEFVQYKQQYENRVKDLEVHSNKIKQGETPELDAIYNSILDISNSVANSSDILTYMYFLQDFDDHTFHHSTNVSLLCKLMGKWLKCSEEDARILTIAGALHDIGKTEIEKGIINKPGKLTDEEFDRMKKHPIIGYNLLKNLDVPEAVKLSALMHHEKIDKSGYPLGIDSSKINDFSKIVTICDIYEAMTAKRSYKEPMCPFKVIEYFELSLLGALDTEKLLTFLRQIANNYVGTKAELNDGQIVEIMFISPESITHPVVKTINGDLLPLKDFPDLKIVELK